MKKKVVFFLKKLEPIIVVYGVVSFFSWVTLAGFFYVFGQQIFEPLDLLSCVLWRYHIDYSAFFYIDGFCVLYAIFYFAYYG